MKIEQTLKNDLISVAFYISWFFHLFQSLLFYHQNDDKVSNTWFLVWVRITYQNVVLLKRNGFILIEIRILATACFLFDGFTKITFWKLWVTWFDIRYHKRSLIQLYWESNVCGCHSLNYSLDSPPLLRKNANSKKIT